MTHERVELRRIISSAFAALEQLPPAILDSWSPRDSTDPSTVSDDTMDALFIISSACSDLAQELPSPKERVEPAGAAEKDDADVVEVTESLLQFVAPEKERVERRRRLILAILSFIPEKVVGNPKPAEFPINVADDPVDAREARLIISSACSGLEQATEDDCCIRPIVDCVVVGEQTKSVVEVHRLRRGFFFAVDAVAVCSSTRR
mmetsp:Transcript_12925/g.18830  ORF Transcript_12925/g.18830 Transcript_12925/m.18830 type:complete len:205 (+) Transcript_12925:2024-2638(+)